MKINGTDLRLFIEDKAASSALQLVGASKTCTLTVNADNLDATNKSVKGWTVARASKASWEVTTQILISDDAATYTLSDLINGLGLKDLAISMGYSGGYYEGEAVISKVSINATDNELSTIDITLTGNGELSFTSTQSAEITAALAADAPVPTSSIIIGSDFCMTDASNVIIGSTKSFTLDVEVKSIELASKKNGVWKEYSFGKKSYSMSGELLVDTTEDYADATLFNAMESRLEIPVYARLLNETRDAAIVGSTSIDGAVVVTNLTLAAQDDELATYSFSGTGTGALTTATVAE